MNFFDERPIGLFDSGVGGLSVLKKMREIFPNENFIYVADTSRVPYGEKTPQQIKDYTLECFEVLNEQNVKSAIIACNTSTAYGLDLVSERFDFPTIGVIKPATKDAIKSTDNNKILLWATDATVKSDIYKDSIKEIDSNIELKSQGCPELVVAVESGHGEDDVGYEVCKEYIEESNNFDYDTIILGCTHFPLAESNIRVLLREYGKDVRIVNPAFSTAKQMEQLLRSKKLTNDKGNGQIKFFISGDTYKFKFVAADVLNLREDEIDVCHFDV